MSAAPVAGGAAAGASVVTSSVRAEPRSVAQVAVLGVTGYSGQEFARLAVRHPGLRLVALCTREAAGRPVAEALPGVDPRVAAGATAAPGHGLPAQLVDPDAAFAAIGRGEIDTLVCCLPHGAWKALAEAHAGVLAERAAMLRIVDLSSDHRDGAAGYVYGQPEVFRARIDGAMRLANPGCYATAATLALLPALEQGWVREAVFVSAVSGISGAGRAAALRTSFVERDGGAELYRAGTEHAHVPEMLRTWNTVAGHPLEVGFAPQLAPMSRGILAVVNAPLATPVGPHEVEAAYAARYAREPFVRVLTAGTWPDTRAVRGSNRCDVVATSLHGGRTLMASAVLDNLVKGAAGQAIQNLNLMLGWPEATGLPVDGLPW